MAKGINLTGTTVSARDDAFIYDAIINNTGVYNKLNNFDYTLVSANKIRISSGMCSIQGRQYIVYPDETIDLTISNGSQSSYRKDLVVVEFNRNGATETIELKVLKGNNSTSSLSSAVDPELSQDETLLTTGVYQLPLFRINLDGINVDSIDDLREYIEIGKGNIKKSEILENTLITDYFTFSKGNYYKSFNIDVPSNHKVLGIKSIKARNGDSGTLESHVMIQNVNLTPSQNRFHVQVRALFDVATNAQPKVQVAFTYTYVEV